MADRFDALAYALRLVEERVLHINEHGAIWRGVVLNRWRSRRTIVPRRAESPTRKGYLAVVLGIPGTKRTCKVYAHVLVWTYLFGAIPEGLQVNHKKPDEKANNNPSNLELMTPSENIQHSYDNGRTRPWPAGHEWRPGKPLITDDQKQHVIALCQSGLGSHRISKATGISKSHVERILNAHGGIACLRK